MCLHNIFAHVIVNVLLQLVTFIIVFLCATRNVVYLKQKWLLFNVITNMSGMALLSMNYVMIYKCICLHICTCVHVGIYICSGGSNIEDPPLFFPQKGLLR